MKIITQGMVTSNDYAVAQRSRMSKILCCMMDSGVMDRTGKLMILDIFLASVKTNHGCVDLVMHEGLLSWCQGLIIKQTNTDQAVVRKMVMIASNVWETATRIDASKKQREEGGDAEEDKRLLCPEVIPLLSSLLQSSKAYFGCKNDGEMLSEVENINQNIKSYLLNHSTQ